ncbi:D8Ertd354e protein [Zea mays]|uniref:D8Ertd354e protein n=1 Tax=Zea mays TaxID=4577 RepID=A0A1D6MYA1_MAIZE|nr:D8Ertd354e protein [Zea mays]
MRSILLKRLHVWSSTPGSRADSPLLKTHSMASATGVSSSEMAVDHATGPGAVEKPRFDALTPNEMSGGRPQFRKVPMPQHRFAPLKRCWMEIYKPVYEHMKIDIRMNLKAILLKNFSSSQTLPIQISPLLHGAPNNQPLIMEFSVLEFDDLGISPISNLSMLDYNDYHRTIDCILQIAVKKLNPESVQGLQSGRITWRTSTLSVTIECSGLFSTPVLTTVRIGASFTIPWFYYIDHLGWAGGVEIGIVSTVISSSKDWSRSAETCFKKKCLFLFDYFDSRTVILVRLLRFWDYQNTDRGYTVYFDSRTAKCLYCLKAVFILVYYLLDVSVCLIMQVDYSAYVHNSSSLHMTASFFSLLDSFHFCPLGYKDFPDLGNTTSSLLSTCCHVVLELWYNWSWVKATWSLEVES